MPWAKPKDGKFNAPGRITCLHDALGLSPYAVLGADGILDGVDTGYCLRRKDKVKGTEGVTVQQFEVQINLDISV